MNDMRKSKADLCRELAELRRQLGAADDARRGPESEAKFAALLEQIDDGVLVLQDDVYIFCNRAIAEMSGYTPEEILRLPHWLDLIAPPARGTMRQRHELRMQGGTPPPRYDSLLLCKDGTIKDVEVSGRRVLINGRPANVGLVRDVTERKRAHADLERRVAERTAELERFNEVLRQEISQRQAVDAALRESEARYRQLFEECPIPLVEQDWSAVRDYVEEMKAQGVTDLRAELERRPEAVLEACRRIRLLDCNRESVRFMGFESKADHLRAFDRSTRESSMDYVRHVLPDLCEGRTTSRCEIAAKTLRGDVRHILVHFTLREDAATRWDRCLIAVMDVTDLRRAEQELVVQRQAVLLQRMESLAVTGRLAAGVAHEINNPLQGIIAQLRLLQDELPADFRNSRRLRLVGDSLSQIAKIVRNLLALHREPANGTESSPLQPVLNNLSDLVATELAAHGVKIQSKVVPLDLVVPMSASKLTQVLLNLILNAGDAMPLGGCVRIEAYQKDGETRILVRDEGTGISPENRARLFSPFFTTKGPQGTGLGLSVTHSLITGAGGNIDVLDGPDPGTTFVIRFGGQR